MTLTELIDVGRTRLVYLAKQRETAGRLGDSQQLASIDKEIAETQETLTKLLTLE